MPGCSAINCTNSFSKGYAMYRFPRDPKRRKEWLVQMRCEEWVPTDASRLCVVGNKLVLKYFVYDIYFES